MARWQWNNLAARLDPWLNEQTGDSRRRALLLRMAELLEHADIIGGDEVPGGPALARMHTIDTINVTLVWTRVEQFRTLYLVDILDHARGDPMP